MTNWKEKLWLVDDGIATGATIVAAARWIKNKHHCKSLIVAVPVVPAKNSDTIDDLKDVADKVIIPNVIDEFFSVGQFYINFNQVSDKDVKEIMKKYGYNIL
jgi:putative phosphoribosyl transferase